MNKNLRPGRPLGSYYHGIVATPPACDQCPLRYKKKVLPDGPVPARLAFIGEEPGRTEERVGRGFVGPSGDLLWNHLCVAANIAREDCWVSNAILCRAERVQLSNGAIIERAVVQQMAATCCYKRLVDELLVVDPVVCIPLGNIALRQLIQVPRANIYNYRGSRSEIDIASLSDTIARHTHGV
jgi:uracil-DNA glycosylase family 4